MGITYTIVFDIRTIQLRQYALIQKTSKEELLKQILAWVAKGKRNKKKLRRIWKEHSDKQIRETAFPENLWKDIGRRDRTI